MAPRGDVVSRLHQKRAQMHLPLFLLLLLVLAHRIFKSGGSVSLIVDSAVVS
jgi:hypothetical protein